MGNEGSQLNGLVIEEKPVEVTDFWSHCQAKINDSCRHFGLMSDGSVSVFKGQAALGPLWTVSTPLEKFSNNLLKYRHPCIIRYISSWQQRNIFHLATEYVQPLSHILSSQTPLQICIGLNSILRALIFLHEQAHMSHNNVSISAIYVSGDGHWKLGGLQYLCAFKDLTDSYLKHARLHRYDKAIDPNEDSNTINTKLDQYAFAVLVEDVFKGRSDGEVPHLKEFKQYCRESLQNIDPAKRPNLIEVAKHNFFNHQFISIFKFLTFLPLKSEDDRMHFFSNILENLKNYDEETVAKQLGGLLLSRLTLLDQTARKDVLPYILKPKSERVNNGDNMGFFSTSVFKEHVKPRLMQLFAVRDTQIRMLLLSHFTKFVQIFSHDELSKYILPELLLGIKDTDDNLVASTLVCLSELVPILGATAVIGSKRSKYFTDGRPNSKINSVKGADVSVSVKTSEDFSCTDEIFDCISKDSIDFSKITLNERPSPVGGESVDEVIVLTEESKKNRAIESEEDWSDWENTNAIQTKSIEIDANSSRDIENGNCDEINSKKNTKDSENKFFEASKLIKASYEAKKNIVDITELDIKSQKIQSPRQSGEEFDFFADMTPVIEKPAVISITDTDEVLSNIKNKLNFIPNDEIEESEGWGDGWNE